MAFTLEKLAQPGQEIYNETNNNELIDNIYKPLYKYLYEQLDITNPESFQIDYDNLDIDFIHNGKLNAEISRELNRLSRLPNRNLTAEPFRTPAKQIFFNFLHEIPEFCLTIKHISLTTNLIIKSAEAYLETKISPDNFIEAKSIIDNQNRKRWVRAKTKQESQSGVSTLGSTSERLLEIAFDELIADESFFKVNNSKVQSYGDFVLLALPTNLWISVKSNFARERLLASGFTTDIVGAGFFTDSQEFTSLAKIRNFQRVGFLAMYVPDIAITDIQHENNTTTYAEVVNFYEEAGRNLPTNINGTPFIRKLSELPQDIRRLMKKSIKSRTALDL